MSLRGFFISSNNATSSNRKRSFAEISHSESRSPSPRQPSAKRQRIALATTSSNTSIAPPRDHNNPNLNFTENSNWVTQRYERDGLDCRRPIMTTSTSTQTLPDYIDLTEEDQVSSSSQSHSGINSLIADGLESRRTDNLEGRTGVPWLSVEDEERFEERRGRWVTDQRAREVGRQEQRNAVIARTQAGSSRGPRADGDIIINLTESDDEEQIPGQEERPLEFPEDLFEDAIENPVDRLSPDVTFVEERPAPERATPFNIPARNNNRRLPTPEDRRESMFTGPLPNLRELMRFGPGVNSFFGEPEIVQSNEPLSHEDLDRIDGISNDILGRQNRNRTENRNQSRDHNHYSIRNPPPFFPRPEPIGRLDWVDLDLELNYQAAAFDVLDQADDSDALEILEGPPWPAAVARHAADAVPQDPFKPPYIKPKQLPHGFTMNYEEDDWLECPNCHDELGVGSEDSVKSQVWMAKWCGHVYCGQCATNRSMRSRTAGKKGKAMAVVAADQGVVGGGAGDGATSNGGPPFSECVVPGCGKSVRGKALMFPLYL